MERSTEDQIPTVSYGQIDSTEEESQSKHKIKHDAENGDDDDDISKSDSSQEFSFLAMTRDEKFTVATFCIANFCVGAFYSLLAPFFPQEAAKKGVNPTVTGLIFGCFELIIVCFSPLFGNYLTRIGAKFTYCTGVMVCGSTSILFGFLDQCPDGATYIIMCFAVRLLEAFAAAAFTTASFAIMANTFPNNVATVFGALELFSGLGLMCGPPLGGLLFQAGGFRLPFASMGSLLVCVGLISCFLLPSQSNMHNIKRGSILSLLTIPIIAIMCFLCLSASLTIGFLDVTLAIFLEENFQLSPVALGGVFLVGPGIYAFTAPIWGIVADKIPQQSWKFMVIGYLIGGGCFLLIGPAPFLPISEAQLWMVILSWGCMGLGIGTIVIAFQVITMAATDAGHPENLDTFGLISGIFNMFFSLGAFVGPVGGGALSDQLGFEWSCVIVSGFVLLGAIVLLCFKLCCERRRPQSVSSSPMHNEQNEQSPLLASHSSTSYTQPVQT